MWSLPVHPFIGITGAAIILVVIGILMAQFVVNPDDIPWILGSCILIGLAFGILASFFVDYFPGSYLVLGILGALAGFIVAIWFIGLYGLVICIWRLVRWIATLLVTAVVRLTMRGA